jgi:hypothetical protein
MREDLATARHAGSSSLQAGDFRMLLAMLFLPEALPGEVAQERTD